MVLTGMLMGFNAMESRYNEMARIEQLPLEELYHHEMTTGKTIALKKFFPQFEMVRHTRTGNLIFTSGADSLYYIRKDVINGYLSYTLEDNHNNRWYLFQDGEMFFLSKRQEE